MAGELFSWLVGWLVDWSVGWVVGWLVGLLAGWLASLLALLFQIAWLRFDDLLRSLVAHSRDSLAWLARSCPGLAFAWLAWFARLARWLASLTWLSWFTWLAWFAWLLDLLRLIASLCLLASLLKLRYLHAWDRFSLLFKLYLFSWLARLAHSLVLNFLKHDFFEKNRNFSA